MAVDRVPYAVGGGAEHSPEIARQATYDSTGGNEGISSPGALRVLAQPVPNGSVRVIAGGSLLLNRYPGGAGQTYAARNATQTTVNISPTSSAGQRTDLIVMRILDPQYEGNPPADPNNFDYTRLVPIQGVPAGIQEFKELNLAYPAIALAKVTLPPSTATVTQAMITDLRKVAQPKRDTFEMTRALIGGDTGLLLGSTVDYPVGEWFPNVGGQSNTGRYDVKIPDWAVKMTIRCEWNQVLYPAKSGHGYVWVNYGPDANTATPTYYTQAYGWDADENANPYRTSFLVEQEVDVPAFMRGTVQQFIPKGTRNGDPAAYPGRPTMTALSGITFKVTFKELADPNAGL